MSFRVAASLWFVAGVFAFAAAAGGGSLESARGLAWSAGATSVGLLCWALGGALASGQPPARRLGWVPSGLSPAVLAGLVLGMLAVSQMAEWLIAWAGYQEVGNLPKFRRAFAEARGPDLSLTLVGVALLPGIAEELALRGWIQRGLEPHLGPVAAVGLTSLLFALLHGEPVHAAGAGLLGLYLGAIVALCGSTRPAVLCHVANNVVATLGAALGLRSAAALLVVVGFAAGPWAFRHLWLRRRPAPSALVETPEAGDAGDPPSAAD